MSASPTGGGGHANTIAAVHCGWCPESCGGESCDCRAPSIDDQTFTVSREQALEAYAVTGMPYLDCGDFVVLNAFTIERRVITVEDRKLRLISFIGELFRLDTGVTVTYAGSARREATFGPAGEIETVTVTGLGQYLIDLEGNRIVFDVGFRSIDLSSFPPVEVFHGIHQDMEVVCGALA